MSEDNLVAAQPFGADLYERVNDGYEATLGAFESVVNAVRVISRAARLLISETHIDETTRREFAHHLLTTCDEVESSWTRLREMMTES